MKKLAFLVGSLLALGACQTDPEPYSANEPFPKGQHILLPPKGADHVVAGNTTLGNPEYIEEQPLAFNHKIHAGAVEDGGMEMECTYCHSTARVSTSAGVPSTQACWNCHKQIDPNVSKNDDRNEVDSGTGETLRNESGRVALQTLDEYCGAERGQPTCTSEEPIPWARVHDLPDFTHFNHSMHIRPGADGEPRVKCQECHGPMETRMVAERENSLLMGWCLDCHQNHPSVDENYGTQSELRRAELKDCWTCHK